MIDVSAVKSTTTLGKLIRLPLRLIPPFAVVPILQGGLRGARWIVWFWNTRVLAWKL
jgi:hypothetical protein